MNNTATTLLIGRVLLFCIGCAVILAITSSITSPASINTTVLSIGLALIGAVLLTIVFARWEKLSLTAVWIMPGNRTVQRVLAGLFIGALLAVLQPILVFSFGHITLARSETIGLAAIATNFFLYLLAACREEVAFRGYPMSALNNRIGAAAQVIIAAIFIIEHKISGMNWLEAIVGPGMGAIFFGLAALKTKGLALSTGLHTAWNFVQWFLGFKGDQGFYRITVEKGFEASTSLIGWVSYTVVMLLGICVISLYFRNKPNV